MKLQPETITASAQILQPKQMSYAIKEVVGQQWQILLVAKQ
jgi:hypothetical protein